MLVLKWTDFSLLPKSVTSPNKQYYGQVLCLHSSMGRPKWQGREIGSHCIPLFRDFAEKSGNQVPNEGIFTVNMVRERPECWRNVGRTEALFPEIGTRDHKKQPYSMILGNIFLRICAYFETRICAILVLSANCLCSGEGLIGKGMILWYSGAGYRQIFPGYQGRKMAVDK